MGLDCYFTKRSDIFKEDEDGLIYYRLTWSGVRKEFEFSNKLGIKSALSLGSLDCWKGNNGEHFLLKKRGDFINVYKEYVCDEDLDKEQLKLCQKENFSTFTNILENGLIKLKKYIYETSKIDFEELMFAMNKNKLNTISEEPLLAKAYKNNEYFYVACFSFLIYSSILYSIENKIEFDIYYD